MFETLGFCIWIFDEWLVHVHDTVCMLACLLFLLLLFLNLCEHEQIQTNQMFKDTQKKMNPNSKRDIYNNG